MGRLKPIAAPLLVAALLRLAVLGLALAVAPKGPQLREPDSEGYARAAAEIVKSGTFGGPGAAEIERTPGYPLLLTPGVAVGRVEVITVGLQLALASLTVWLVYRTARVVYEQERIALTAAWLCAFEPVSIIYTSKLLTETLFTTLLAAAIWCLVRYTVATRWSDLVLAAAALAAATYVRPISYYLPLWIAPVLFIVHRRSQANLPPEDGLPRPSSQKMDGLGRPSSSASAVILTAFAALSMTLVGVWQVRNWLVAGYAGFAAIADVNLYYYEALPVVAQQRGIPPGEWDEFQVACGQNNPAAYLTLHPEQRDWPPARRYAFLRHEALRIIREHPWQWLRLHLVGTCHTLFDSGRNAWLGFFGLAGTSKEAAVQPAAFRQRLTAALKERPLVLAIHGLLGGTLVAYLGLALVGIVARPWTPAIAVLLAVAFYFLMLSGGAAGYHRFRLPLVPIISLFAAAGFEVLRQRFRR